MTLIGIGLLAYGIFNIKKINKRDEVEVVNKSIKISMQEQKRIQSKSMK
jgi:hypothetical protein